jgi:hypothetical protein
MAEKEKPGGDKAPGGDVACFDSTTKWCDGQAERGRR